MKPATSEPQPQCAYSGAAHPVCAAWLQTVQNLCIMHNIADPMSPNETYGEQCRNGHAVLQTLQCAICVCTHMQHKALLMVLHQTRISGLTVLAGTTSARLLCRKQETLHWHICLLMLAAVTTSLWHAQRTLNNTPCLLRNAAIRWFPTAGPEHLKCLLQ